MATNRAQPTERNIAPANEESALVVDGLSVQVRGRPVLRDVSLRVPRGRAIGIVGETGSGKTMTCRAITGRLNRIDAHSTAGTVTYDGIDLTNADSAQWRRLYGRRIALVPQNSLSGLDPVIRVGRQLRETVRELDPKTDQMDRSRELLTMVGLSEQDRVLRAYPHELSGGMRQRVMIALALAGRPELLIADEPTSALDVTVQHSIIGLLNEVRAMGDISIVFVTHDLTILESSVDTIAVMYAGTTVEVAPTAEVLGNPQHPYTRGLLASRPSATSRGSKLPTIPGNPRPLTVALPGCQFAPRCERATEICRTVVPPLEQMNGHGAVACYHPGEKS